MIAEIGLAALWLAAALGGLQLVPARWAGRRDQEADVRGVAVVQAALLALALGASLIGFVRSDLSMRAVARYSQSWGSAGDKLLDALNNPHGAGLLAVTVLAMSGVLLARMGLHPATQSRARTLQQVVTLLLLTILLIAANPFARSDPPPPEGLSLGQPVDLAYVSPLLVIGLAWLVMAWTIWLASRQPRDRKASGNRAARVWTWLALAAMSLGTAAQLELPDASGELANFREWSAADVLAGLAWLAALGAAARLELAGLLRSLRRGGSPRVGLRQAGTLVLACGVAASLLGLGAAVAGSSRQQAFLCPGTVAKFGRRTVSLVHVQPVAGEGFTAREAELMVRTDAAAPLVLRPRDTEYFRKPGLPNQIARHVYWDGELAARLSVSSEGLECATVDLWWRPLVNWFRYGAWLAALGALLMALAALASLRWRSAVRRRIGHRREDRRLREAQSA